MTVLVLGSGGREHALALACTRDPQVGEVHVAPGNPGTARIATNHPDDATDPHAVVELARRIDADLVVIGPEAPLVAGVADAVREAGIACFGPSARAAALEGSKAFAKEVMASAGVPTAEAHECTDLDEVAAALDALGAPHVVKDDGLAGGKGVVVTEDRQVALDHARACLTGGHHVLVEEFLDGPEVSLFAICDGTRALPMQPAQDFKRVGEADTGPNTGGMGAYSPLPWAPRDLVPTVAETVITPVLAEMARRGQPFCGLLYTGLALTQDGPKVVEFNVRFGDPETEVLLELLESPLAQVLAAAAAGDLSTWDGLRFRSGAAVGVVLANEGYPGPVGGARPLTGVEDADGGPDPMVLQAGTVVGEDGSLLATGGRVLVVVGQGETLAGARQNAYHRLGRIDLPGGFHRSDIAARAAEEEAAIALGTPSSARDTTNEEEQR